MRREGVVCWDCWRGGVWEDGGKVREEEVGGIGGKGGVVEVWLYRGLVGKEGGGDMLDGIEEVNEMVKVMGMEDVGMGSEFEGEGGIMGWKECWEMMNVSGELVDEG